MLKLNGKKIQFEQGNVSKICEIPALLISSGSQIGHNKDLIT